CRRGVCGWTMGIGSTIARGRSRGRRFRCRWRRRGGRGASERDVRRETEGEHGGDLLEVSAVFGDDGRTVLARRGREQHVSEKSALRERLPQIAPAREISVDACSEPPSFDIRKSKVAAGAGHAE